MPSTSREKAPLIGILNQSTPTVVTRAISKKLINAKGMVLPRISSIGRIGVTNFDVARLAELLEAGVPVVEEHVVAAERDRASEAFLTSTTIELLPIREMDGRPVGEGRPGPVWRRLIEGYRALVTRETGVPLTPLP